MYGIKQSEFEAEFLGKSGNFQHKTNQKYNLLPFTGSTSDKPLDSFDNILGAFLRNIYSLSQPSEINREEIISKICKNMTFDDNPTNEIAFRELVKDIYFVDSENLKCTSINTYKYTSSTKNDHKISEYIVSALCDKEKIVKSLSEIDTPSGNLLDKLVEECLPELKPKATETNYLALMPQIAECFTKDLIFLIKDSDSEFYDMIQLISYYYFFYTSQIILNLNRFCKSTMEICPVYFIMSWEKTSKTRECSTRGWHQIEGKLNSMFSHAVLLEMLNQTGQEKKYSYRDIFEEYENSSYEERNQIFSEIEKLKNQYRTIYAEPDGFIYTENNYSYGDIESLICGFFDDIMLQFEKTARSRANEAYQNSFHLFCRNNFLQNRKKNGLMLALNEEQLVLMTKIIIGNKKQMRLNTLFEEFKIRGIFMDKLTQEAVVEFYEKLNLIEKKSDSGDAQYVKGIL